MVYNPTFRNLTNVLSKKLVDQGSGEKVIFGRVIDIILDQSHPQYKKYGEVESINGIFYKDINDSTLEGDREEALPFAYSYDSTIVRVPLKGEIVKIQKEPARTIGGSEYPYSDYYTSIINIWNTPHHNSLPDTKEDVDEIDLGKNAIEQSTITGLQPYTGDVIVEGRLGQSLRFSGFKHPLNKLSDNSNNGKPFAILKVGQDPDFNELTKYIEDINTDLSSIYITSDHSVPVNTSINKQDTFLKEDKPELLDTFKGNQIILDSGRIVLHSKSDSILLNSLNSITLGSNTLNIDSLDYISIDAPSIFIGAKAEEPAVLGDKNEELLKRLFNLLKTIARTFNSVKDPTSVVPALAVLAPIIDSEANALQSQLAGIKSKKVKVE